MNRDRIKIIQQGQSRNGPVVYWMQRDQRTEDNWALLHAQQTALENGTQLYVIFCFVPGFLNAGLRQYYFMLKGLREVEHKFTKLNIPFIIKKGNPASVIPKFVSYINAGLLVTDFNPLKIVRSWKADVIKNTPVTVLEADAHNIVPCWLASPKEEFAAYTFRPKINKMLDEFLEDFPPLKRMPFDIPPPQNNWEEMTKSIAHMNAPAKANWITPGEDAANAALKHFIDNKLHNYNNFRNDPNAEAQSNLSPYLHFGHISAQRLALSVQPMIEHAESQKAFLEELIVRRELADNFCFYNPDYDSFEGFYNWAKETLNKHRKDKREFLYTTDQFELAQTHDPLWNAAQLEMLSTGKMHGYMRMYWAKKILEWTKSPEEALQTAIYLNDKYQLDGRDPNGYTGIAWSIGGVHDRAWAERNVFGKVRYMNYNGCKRKFNIAAYIAKHSNGST